MQGLATMRLCIAALLSTVMLGHAAAPDWPSFRGADRNNHSPDKNLLKSWPEDGPKLEWTAKGLGGGYSSVTLVGDRIYTLGNKGRQSHLLALNRENGKVIWSTPIGASGGNLGSTPTVDGDHIYAISSVSRRRAKSSGKRIFRTTSTAGVEVGATPNRRSSMEIV